MHAAAVEVGMGACQEVQMTCSKALVSLRILKYSIATLAELPRPPYLATSHSSVLLCLSLQP